MRPKIDPFDTYKGRPLAPLIAPEDLRYGDIVLHHCPTDGPVLDSNQTRIGVFLGLSDIGAQIFMEPSDWVQFQLGRIPRDNGWCDCRTWMTFAQSADGKEKTVVFLYRKLGSFLDHRFPDKGESTEPGLVVSGNENLGKEIAELEARLAGHKAEAEANAAKVTELNKRLSDRKGVENAGRSMRTSLAGMKVRFAFPNAGYESDQKDAARFLVPDKVYIVARVWEGATSSTVKLAEIPEQAFNTVHFAEV